MPVLIKMTTRNPRFSSPLSGDGSVFHFPLDGKRIGYEKTDFATCCFIRGKKTPLHSVTYDLPFPYKRCLRKRIYIVEESDLSGFLPLPISKDEKPEEQNHSLPDLLLSNRRFYERLK